MNFGTRHDFKYNANKSAVMIYRSMTLKGCTMPTFKQNGIILHVVASYKYLGHYITDDLSDDDDINRQRRTLFVQGNIILRKFNMCSLGVKLTIFFSRVLHTMFKARSLNANCVNIYDYLIGLSLNFDIIAISETWIQSDSIAEFQIKSVSIEGILECVTVAIQLNKPISKTCVISCIYRTQFAYRYVYSYS